MGAREEHREDESGFLSVLACRPATPLPDCYQSSWTVLAASSTAVTGSGSVALRTASSRLAGGRERLVRHAVGCRGSLVTALVLCGLRDGVTVASV